MGEGANEVVRTGGNKPKSSMSRSGNDSEWESEGGDDSDSNNESNTSISLMDVTAWEMTIIEQRKNNEDDDDNEGNVEMNSAKC